jgi:hypothetical protein
MPHKSFVKAVKPLFLLIRVTGQGTFRPDAGDKKGEHTQQETKQNGQKYEGVNKPSFHTFLKQPPLQDHIQEKGFENGKKIP